MKKLRILIFSILLYKYSASQSSISLGPQLGFGTNLSNTTIGIGGSLEYQYKFSRNLGITSYIGYDYFNGKSTGHLSFLPVRIGLQRYFSEMFFLSGTAGIASISPNNGETNTTGFSYSLGAGYYVPFGSVKQFLQLALYFNSSKFTYSTYNWLNIRVAYGIGLSKKAAQKND
jgi:hypothetical protein